MNRIICKNPDYGLTFGKIYFCSMDKDFGLSMPNCFLIENDFGSFRFYTRDYFMTIEDGREEKLNQIGI